MSRQNILGGIVLLLFSSVCFAVMSVLIRIASHTMHNTSIVFFRNFYSLFILLPLILSSNWLTSLKRPQNLKLHFLRSIVGIAGMYCFFFAIAKMELSKAMVFPYSSSLFIPFIAWFWLKEKTLPVIYLYIGIGFIGVLCIVKPGADMMNWVALLGICSSFMTAVAMISIRLLGRTESAKNIALNFTIVSTFISLPIYLINYQSLALMDHLMLLAIGLLAAVAQLTMSKAYSMANAGSLAAIPYTTIFFSGILAYIVWDEVPSRTDVIGISLIVLSTLLTIFTNHFYEKRMQPATL